MKMNGKQSARGLVLRRRRNFSTTTRFCAPKITPLDCIQYGKDRKSYEEEAIQ
jgi:hypothetical protein